LRDPACPKLLVATTRVRDGRLQLFRNQDLTADVVLASTCPALVHCAVGDGFAGFGFQPTFIEASASERFVAEPLSQH
jgi:NTE family protein